MSSDKAQPVTVSAIPRDPSADGVAARLSAQPPPAGHWPAEASVPVSVLVPVRNEAAILADCLRRVRWANQIVVVDSQSRDATAAIAQALGAQVYQFHYSAQGWPKKKNWTLEHVPWDNEWVLIVDADEHVTPELAQQIEAVVTGGSSSPTSSPRGRGAGRADGYWINRRFMFMGRWIRHCGYYPSYNLRLFKHRLGRYERIGDLGDTGTGDNEVHEHVVLATGPGEYLDGHLLHYAYPDLATWVAKHNRYSTWEAHAAAAGDQGQVKASLAGGPIQRRRWLKSRSRKLPCRPLLRFIYSYVIKLGFLDGYAGYVLCRLLAWYEFVSIAKYREMRLGKSPASPAGRS